MKRVGFLTIGQSPRDDVLDEVRPLLEGIDIVEAGALDGLSEEELTKISVERKKGGDVLISKLRDGRSIVIGKTDLIPLLQRAMDKLSRSEVDLMVLLCTGDIQLPYSPIPVILPGKLIKGLVKSTLPRGGVLGVLVPLEEQRDQALGQWIGISSRVSIACLSPYQAQPDYAVLNEPRGCDLIVLDCMGYRKAHKSLLVKRVRGPVILPRTLVARLVLELI